MNRNTDISDLIAKHITDTLSIEERELLDEWLEDPYNQLQFDVLTSKEIIQKNRTDFDQFDPEEDWGKLDREISRKKRVLHWMKYAAAIVLPVGIALFTYLYSDSLFETENLVAQNEFALESEEVELKMHDGKVYAIHNDTAINRADVHIRVDSSRISYEHKQIATELEYNTIRIPRGKQYQLNLSDGTKVWLNADTEFRYPIAFVGDKREVFIESGEAFFDVTKNKEKPFIVNFNKHQVKVFEEDDPGYFGRAIVAQDLSAVTAACLMVSRHVWEQLDGLDEENLAVAFNDVDFCLRVREAGLRVVFTPYAKLYHHESVSRGKDDSPEKAARAKREADYMRSRWKPIMSHDPFYNPNLNYSRPDFTLNNAPMVNKPWLYAK